MSRILLVDDSPHAQRMGERILSDEGYEVVTVSNADSALIRLEDVDPDVVLADTVMPGPHRLRDLPIPENEPAPPACARDSHGRRAGDRWTRSRPSGWRPMPR